MSEILNDFKNSFENNPYNVIKYSMVYCSKFITPDIISNISKLNKLYDSYHLYKITSFSCISNSYLYAYLHIILLFDHSFVSCTYKRNNYIKLSKLKNDTTNNILYLYCKQYSLNEIQNNLLTNLDKYQYDIDYITDIIIKLEQEFNIDINQRINIMLHSNDNESITKHEHIILDNLYNAFYHTIDKLGDHLTTQNACLTDETP
jgi:hypothetical protein